MSHLRFAFLSIVMLFAELPRSSALADRRLYPKLIESAPKCNVPGHRSTWCSRGSYESRIPEQEEFIKQLVPQESNETISRIFISTYLFTNSQWVDYLCRQLSLGRSVTIALDIEDANDNNAFRYLSAGCSGRAGKRPEIFRMSAHSETGIGSAVYHSKMITHYMTNDEVSIVFGSANVSSSALGFHFENWNKVRTPKVSSFAKQHLCYERAAVKAAASFKSHSPSESRIARQIFQDNLINCRREERTLPFEEALIKEGIAPIFTLIEEDQVKERIIGAIDSVTTNGEILVTMQLISGYDQTRALMRAVGRGVNVRIVMDDDILFEIGDAGKITKFYRKYLEPSGMLFRFIETNFSNIQMLHSRYLILDKRLIITGSGYLSETAVSNNYENYYFSTDESYIAQHVDSFERLWALGYEDPGRVNSVRAGVSAGLLSIARSIREFVFGKSDS